MTTQPFAVWSSITLLRTEPPSASTLVTTSAVWCPATEVSTVIRAPMRACCLGIGVRRALGRDELVAAHAVAQLGPGEVVEQVEVELVPRPLVRDRDVGRTRTGLAADRDPHEQQQPGDDDRAR